MKILVVAFANSIHTVRWLEQFAHSNHEIHLFPSVEVAQFHPSLRHITVHAGYFVHPPGTHPSVTVKGVRLWHPRIEARARGRLAQKSPHYYTQYLAKVIQNIQPDLIHTLEIQHAGYLVDQARPLATGVFPPWLVTPWGSDLYLFGRIPAHQPQIRSVLNHANYFVAESKRDTALAQVHGFSGQLFPIVPATSGFHAKSLPQIAKNKPSKRAVILVKGYQGWAGRALVALAALKRAADALQGYRIIVHSTEEGSGVDLAAQLLSAETGLPATIVPHSSHATILKLYSESRIALNVSVSDGVPSSLLEAMAYGAFPIQSSTSCAEEWVNNGESCLLVPPEDPGLIEQAIRRAMQDDRLVDTAARINQRTILNRMEYKTVQQAAHRLYDSIEQKLKA